jgi:hypothetical protein
MEDHIAPGDGVVHTLVALDVSLHELDVLSYGQDAGAVPGGEVVQDPHLMAELG